MAPWRATIMATKTDVPTVWTRNLSIVPSLSNAFIERWANETAKVPKKLMTRRYAFFSGSYVHNVEGK